MMATIAGFLRYIRRTSAFRQIERSLRGMSAFRKEIERSYPPEWREVVGAYREKGVELDTLKLRGIVQYIGADVPQQRSRMDPDAPVTSWPTRTPDLADRLRTHPDDEGAARELRRRGYHVSNGELKESPDGSGGRGARKLLRNRIVEELTLYLRPEYQSVDAWPWGETTPMRFARQVHRLLLPYFPAVTVNKVRSTINNMGRPPPD